VVFFLPAAVDVLRLMLLKILDSGTNLEEVSAFDDIRPLPTRIARYVATPFQRNIYTVAGMSGCGKSTAAMLFSPASMRRTGFTVIDADAALSDPALDDDQRDLLRAALSSTFGGAGRGGALSVAAMNAEEDDQAEGSELNGIGRRSVRSAIAWTKAYIWRKISEIEAQAKAEKIPMPNILVLVHQPSEERAYSLGRSIKKNKNASNK